MNINAKYFGSVSYEETDSIHIINGLIGFESHTKYLPIPFQEEDDSMISLQCLDDETLSFILMNPFGIFPDYAPVLSTQDLKELEADSAADISYYVISVNALNRKAKQVILDQPEYTFRHALGDMVRKEDE